MRVSRISAVSAILAILPFAGLDNSGHGAYAQEYQEYQEWEEYPIEARVWMDRGHEPVLQRGELVQLYYRVSENAFVAIFHIDTNGTARMVFPVSPQENHFARGGRDYRVLFPGSTFWHVDDDPGMGYFFAVASPEPFDFSDLRYSHYDGGWDLSFVGRQVYRDPYLAMDDYVAALIPDWEYVPYGLDFTAYHVERRYEYPRFMCYDCHGFRPYTVWNPYHYSCASFRVVIYNDPYYYPVSRYRGTRVVYAQPRRGVAHFSFKERADGEPGTPQVVARNTPPVSQPGVSGTETRRGPSNLTNPSPPGSTQGSGAAVRRSGAGAVPLTTPRSGSSGTNQGVRRITDPVSPAVRPSATPTNRPVLERRPGTGSSAQPRTTGAEGRKTITRPSARVRKGGGASSPPPTVRSGGTSGRTSPPTVRSGGTRGRTSPPTVRSGGTRGRTSPPTVRSGGTSGRTSPPTVRSGGTSGRTSPPTVRSKGGSGKSPPTRTRPPPARKKKTGGGGDQGLLVP